MLPAVVFALIVVGVQASSAAADGCVAYPAAYPGDLAAKDRIAAWMAGGAVAAGIPGELPVMGALVASGVTNASSGDTDAAGYFGMRTSIWDNGPYAGFPTQPALQLTWFLDQASKVREQHVAAGDAAYGTDPAKWGDWDGDILLPAAQYRDRYQLQLDEARILIAAGCDPPPSGSPPAAPPTQPPPSGPVAGPGPTDTVAPALKLGGAQHQDAVGAGAVLVDVTCLTESCTASATASLSLPVAARVYRLTAKPLTLKRGQRAHLRLTLSASIRRHLRAALRRHSRIGVKVRVTVRDAGGNTATATRAITLVAT